jgi:release factor glutamine methyltransferase
VEKVSDFLKIFFAENCTLLQNNYPGLTINRLHQDLDPYWNSLYFESTSDPVYKYTQNLLSGRPISHFLENAYFYESDFIVSEKVLTPRPETEILVEETLKEIRKIADESITICDIGTGTGAIILSVLRAANQPLKAVATDISEDAISIAKRNYFNLGYTIDKDSELSFLKTDRLSGIDGRFNIIVSNPPYIKYQRDRAGVHSQVLDYEPEIALFLDDDEYENWFKKLFTDSYRLLYDKGSFIMEGHEDNLDELKILIEEIGFIDAQIIKDFTGSKRFLKARK